MAATSASTRSRPCKCRISWVMSTVVTMTLLYLKFLLSAVSRQPGPIATIAYAISLTSCGQTSTSSSGSGGHSADSALPQGASTLAHSIHLASVRHTNSGSQFDYHLVAFVHPSAAHCQNMLADLGYHILVRDTPFAIADIRQEFLRTHIGKSGCCGEKEYLKLYSYTLMDFPIVVHLDMDSLILRPLDPLFHALLDSTTDLSRIPLVPTSNSPNRLEAFFTRDYNMVPPGHKHVGIQGGFLVVRPNRTAFDTYVHTVREGNFVQGKGWGGTHGGYFGAQQIQGIASYYYDRLVPGTGGELNRCYYNAMADSPRQPSKRGEGLGLCRDGQQTCQDCREVPISEIVSVHFTICGKPWKCPSFVGLDPKTVSLCEKFHAEWFRIREDWDRKNHGQESSMGGQYRPDIFRGYCKRPYESGYIPIAGRKQ